MIPFLSLKDLTALHAEEIHEVVCRVVDSGWYLQGKEMILSRLTMPNI